MRTILQRAAYLLTAVCLLAGGMSVSDGAAVSADGDAEIEKTKYAALTFDDGPNPVTTPVLLDGLRERGVNATFFLIGEQIADNEELVLRMRDEGHQIGNHTWSHTKLQGLDCCTLQQEIQRTDETLQALLGDGDYWVRPPYGLLNDDQLAQFTEPLVHWTVDPEDWRRKNTAGDVQSILEQMEPNAIILLHDPYQASVDAALQVVDTLQTQGYVFVTVEELLLLNGVDPQPGVMYHSGTD